jgi:hypothetical protein
MRLTMHRVVVVALSFGALIAVAPAAAQEPPPPTSPTIAGGVTIHGVDVAGMTEEEATTAMREFVQRPFAFRFRTKRWTATPWAVGARSYVREAVKAALVAPEGTAVPLRVSVDYSRLKGYVAKLDRDLSRPARDARVRLRDLRPRLTRQHRGFDIRRRPTRLELKDAIRTSTRGPIWVKYRILRPRVTRWNFPPVVVIRRGSHRLYLYTGAHMRKRARFGVAVGQPIYPTPIGKFTIVTKQRNPWWYPPDSDWAAGATPIPPGPGNPLGTRWMGLSAPGVGIHGTPDAASIGYSASHGCIRMRIPDAEWLFERVEVGSTVFIVRA